MTTKITLTYGDAELVVTGEYIAGHRWSYRPWMSEYRIERIEQDGHDVTEHYRQFGVIPLLEDMAREVVESN